MKKVDNHLSAEKKSTHPEDVKKKKSLGHKWTQEKKTKYPSFFGMLAQLPTEAFNFLKQKISLTKKQDIPFGITKTSFDGIQITMGGIVQADEKGYLYVKTSDSQCNEILQNLKRKFSSEELKTPEHEHRSHIAILTNEESQKLKSKAKKAQGKIVRFDEILDLKKIQNKWLLTVKSEDLESIRKSLGLKSVPEEKEFHIVIAEA